jgi:hypothetical protein
LSGFLSSRKVGNFAFAGITKSALLQYILDKGFSGLVTGAYERAGCAVQETHVEGALAPELKSIGCDVVVNGHVTFGGTHVLAKGYDVDIVGAKF